MVGKQTSFFKNLKVPEENPANQIRNPSQRGRGEREKEKREERERYRWNHEGGVEENRKVCSFLF